MTEFNKIFLFLSAIFLLTIIAYVAISANLEKKHTAQHLDRLSTKARFVYTNAQNAEAQSMMQIAKIIGADRQVQQLFFAGKKALIAEGGGRGGRRSAKIRHQLYQLLDKKFAMLSAQFGYRILHFTLGPGAVSFLRVHAPQKFGDNLSSLRKTLVYTNTAQLPASGFEIGRIVFGYRAIIPLFHTNDVNGKKTYIGALGVATNVNTVINTIKKAHPWLDAGIALNKEQLKKSMWPQHYAKLVANNLSSAKYVVIAHSAIIANLISANREGGILSFCGHKLFNYAGRSYNCTNVALRDFQGTIDSARADSGKVILCQEVTTLVNDQRTKQNWLIFYGIVLYLLLEIVTFYALKIITSRLRQQLLRSQQVHKVQQHAVEIVGSRDLLRIQDILRAQLEEAVAAGNAEMGMVVASTAVAGVYNLLAASTMVWSTTAGNDYYHAAQEDITNKGYYAVTLGDNIITRALHQPQLQIINSRELAGLHRCNLPEGHPVLRNLLLVAIKTIATQHCVLILANNPENFSDDNQIMTNSYASAMGLILDTNYRDVENIAIREADQLKSNFFNNVSHELRTPMNSIMALGKMLSASTLTAHQQELIDKVNSSSAILLNLIDEILLVTELDRDAEQPLQQVEFDPRDLIEQLVITFAHRAKENNVTLTTHFAANLPSRIINDTIVLERILRQLIGNAIKFGHDGVVNIGITAVEYCTTAPEVILTFSVTDHGIGLTEEQQQNIFAIFHQGDGSKSRSFGGCGLGLTIANKLCGRLNCHIEVDSTIGEGSCFSFRLATKIANSEQQPDATMESLAQQEPTPPSKLPPGTTQQLLTLLQQLVEPLKNLQAAPCKAICNQLQQRVWPEPLHAQIDQLQNLVGGYRFAQAAEVVNKLITNILTQH